MLPSQKKKRDYSVLESDPEAGRRLSRRVWVGSLVLLTITVFGWLIVRQALTAISTTQTQTGLVRFGLSVFVVLFALGAWAYIRYNAAGLLESKLVWLGVLLSGWFVRGFYESAMADESSRTGFYAGLWGLLLLAGATLVIGLIFKLARILNGRQTVDGA